MAIATNQPRSWELVTGWKQEKNPSDVALEIRLSLDRRPIGEFCRNSGAKIFPGVTEAPFSQEHGLPVHLTCFVPIAVLCVIQAEPKILPAQLLVKNASADPAIDIGVMSLDMFKLL